MIQGDVSALENEFYGLLWPAGEDYIPADECAPGAIYWVRTRKIGEIALCEHDENNTVVFTGLEEEMGQYSLFRELHYDEDDMFGTARPLVKLDLEVPKLAREPMMNWFLKHTITLIQDKISWLDGMPPRFTELAAWQQEREDLEGELTHLLRVKTEGFAAQEPITIKAILAKNKAKLSSAS